MARTATVHKPAEIESYLDAVRDSRGPNAHAALLGIPEFDTRKLHKKVERGFAFVAFLKAVRLMALPMQALAEILLIPPRTLQRRKVSGRLEPVESDRLLRLARVFGKAIELFEGDNRAALEWLESPVTGLGGEAPLSMLKTEPGTQEVERLILRLEHGVFS